MKRAVTILLVASYGIAWGISSVHPFAGAIFLGAITGVAAIPYFLFKMSVPMIIGAVVIAVLSMFFPFLAPLFLLAGLLFRLRGFLRNFPQILCGGVLYALLLTAPSALRSGPFLQAVADESAALGTLVIAAIGALIMLVAMYLLGKLGRPPLVAAMWSLGCFWYLALFTLTFFLPHGGDGDFSDLS
jgi:hypothetical protein